MAKKSEKKDEEEEKKVGDLQDGSQVFMAGAGGSSGGNPDVQIRAAPQVIESGTRRDDSVILGKVPKSFKAEGHPVDAVQSTEVGDINALVVAVNNYMPSGPEGQFFKQSILKILQHLSG